jgi:chromosome partitioning protein
MSKIAIALSKGGVGKTTTAVNLAAGLSRTGKNVLLLDLDTQGQAARALGASPIHGLAEYVSGEVSFKSTCVMARQNLWLLAGGRSMANLKRLITRKDFGGEHTLVEAMQTIDSRFDFVILDTPPGWDALTVNALFYVDRVLAPVSLEVLTLQGLIEFSQSIGAIQKYRPQLALRYILPTFFDLRVRKSEEILEQLQSYFAGLVCSPIRYNVRLSEAPGYGQTIFEYAPNSAGAIDYQQLTERILRDE